MANTAAPRAAFNAATRARPGRTFDPIQRQAAIESALSTALYFARRIDGKPATDRANLWAATARTNRALTLLKTVNADAHAKEISVVRHTSAASNHHQKGI